MLKFYQYSKCDSCRRAKKWLESKNKKFEEIDITLHPPGFSDLKGFLQKSALPLKNFLNRSGIQYRELNMKEKVKILSEDEILKMLAAEGRLIKRPILTDGKKVTVGFDEKLFEECWS